MEIAGRDYGFARVQATIARVRDDERSGGRWTLEPSMS
jgi:hypothetical protein